MVPRLLQKLNKKDLHELVETQSFRFNEWKAETLSMSESIPIVWFENTSCTQLENRL